MVEETYKIDTQHLYLIQYDEANTMMRIIPHLDTNGRDIVG